MSSKTVTYFVVIKVSCLVHCFVLGKVRFLLGGGGGWKVGRGFGGEATSSPPIFLREKPWGRGWRGGCLVIFFLQIGRGQTCFILNRGRVTVFFGKEKLLHVASILYIQAKLPVKINLNYLQVSKNSYIKKLSSPN